MYSTSTTKQHILWCSRGLMNPFGPPTVACRCLAIMITRTHFSQEQTKKRERVSLLSATDDEYEPSWRHDTLVEMKLGTPVDNMQSASGSSACIHITSQWVPCAKRPRSSHCFARPSLELATTQSRVAERRDGLAHALCIITQCITG